MAKWLRRKSVEPEAPVPDPVPAPDVAPDPDPVPVVALAERGTDESCPVVFLRREGALVPVRARSARNRMIDVDGRAYEHVTEHEGAWVYE